MILKFLVPLSSYTNRWCCTCTNWKYMILVDGTIVNGEASINESSMTGEGIPCLFKSVEDSVYLGTVIEEGISDIKVRAFT